MTKNTFSPIGAIIQARTTSSRLPKKIFKDLDGLPVIEQIVLKLKSVNLIDTIVIATTDDPADNVLIEWCKVKNLNYFVGDKENVLSRFYHCAKQYQLKSIVRITSDNPLIDIEIIEKTISLFLQGYDYVANNIIKSFPHGLDVEVFSFNSLERSFIEAFEKSHTEHVTQYIRHNENKFNITNYKSHKNYHDIRVTLDTEEDYNLLKKVVSIGGINIKYNQLIEIFENNKSLKDINKLSKKQHAIYNKNNKII